MNTPLAATRALNALNDMTGSATTLRPDEALLDAALVARIEAFLTAYAHTLDDGQIDDWPGYFSDQTSYQITTRENHLAGYPLGIVNCIGRGMLTDRVQALKTANIYESHVYCHLLGRPQLWADSTSVVRARSNFVIYRTMEDGGAELFASGKYLDLIETAGTALAFRERVAVIDSRRIDTLLVFPI